MPCSSLRLPMVRLSLEASVLLAATSFAAEAPATALPASPQHTGRAKATTTNEAERQVVTLRFVELPEFSVPAATQASKDTLEQRFLGDLGLPANTKRCSCRHAVGLGPMHAVTHVEVQLNLEKFTPQERAKLHLWVGVSAPKSLTTQGWLQASFSQGGVGMSTEMNNRFELGQDIVLGSDYEKAGDTVLVDLTNLSSLPSVDCTLGILVYTP